MTLRGRELSSLTVFLCNIVVPTKDLLNRLSSPVSGTSQTQTPQTHRKGSSARYHHEQSPLGTKKPCKLVRTPASSFVAPSSGRSSRTAHPHHFIPLSSHKSTNSTSRNSPSKISVVSSFLSFTPQRDVLTSSTSTSSPPKSTSATPRRSRPSLVSVRRSIKASETSRTSTRRSTFRRGSTG